MSKIQKIKIKKIKRKEMPSKYREGETYQITEILDSKGRKMAAMGKWAEGWKKGDVIQASIEKSKWTDKNGNEKTNLKLVNPNPPKFNNRAGGGFAQSNDVSAVLIAAEIYTLVSGSKKKATVDSIFELAEEVKTKLDDMQKDKNSGKSSKSVNVDEEDDFDDDDEDEDDDDDDDIDEDDEEEEEEDEDEDDDDEDDDDVPF